MRFNKFLAMCFLASTMMCGSFTSCDDDDDNDNESKKESIINDKTTVEQGREDGKNFGTLAKKGTSISVAEASDLISLASKYKSNSNNKTYKGGFAEGAAETGILGDSSKGDAAIETLDALMSKYESISTGSTTDKAVAIIELLQSLKGNSSSSTSGLE